MTPKISPPVEQYVATSPDGAACLKGSDGTTYWVFTEEAMRVRHYVQEGIADAEAGNVGPWDSAEIKAAGRQLKSRRST